MERVAVTVDWDLAGMTVGAAAESQASGRRGAGPDGVGGSCERAMMCLRIMDLFLMGVGMMGDVSAVCCSEAASAFNKSESTWGEEWKGREGASPGLGNKEGWSEKARWEDSVKR